MKKCQHCGDRLIRWAGLEVLDVSRPRSKLAVVCPKCKKSFNKDVWLSRQFWDAGKPRVKFARLATLR